jgi:membrane protease YdiL (CAAX protease family)
MDLDQPTPSVAEQVPEPPPPRPLAAGRAFGILAAFLLVECAVAVVLAIVAVSYFALRLSDRQALTASAQALTVLPATILGSLLGSVVALRMARHSFPGSIAAGALQPLGWSRASPRILAMNVLLGVLIAAGVVVLLIRQFPPHRGQSFGVFAQLATTPGLSRLAWAFIALAIAPPVEEFLFRGVLLHGLAQSWGLVTAVLLTSAIFVAFHIPETRSYWPALAGICLLAAATVAARLSTKALGPAIAVHVGYNLALVILVHARAA